MKISKENIGYLVTITKEEKGKKIISKGYVVEVFPDAVKLKLIDNGYNIDVTIDSKTKVEISKEKISLGKPSSAKLKENNSLPNICYIGTGGTIGTHVDYVTGGVHMCRTPEEIISTTPELQHIVNIKKIKSPFIKASEDLTFKDWELIAKDVFEELNNKEIDGIIITHGTDTLSWTGTALSFMIEKINKPVLLVGAQRSPDRASFDGAMNLVCAAHFIKEKIAGVYTVMHGTINDDFCYVINACKSKKLHTSRRDAFRAINDLPVCKVHSNGEVEYLKDVNKTSNPSAIKPILHNTFEDKVAIIKAYPNSDPSIIDWYIEKGYRGLIIEGTALGHVPTGSGGLDKDFPKDKNWLPFLEKAHKKGIILIMTSQSMFGRVNGRVYANLRYIAGAGVEYLDSHDMLPEVAYIKLGVALSRFKKREDIIKYMEASIAGEVSDKENPDMFDKALEWSRGKIDA